MAPTRWGIAGSGKISFDFTNALSMLPAENHKVVAVGARALSSAESFAKEFNIPKAYGSYKELAQDPDLDIVYVGTIHPTHFAVSKVMIEAGKNVLCEKPVTMNLKELKAITALAKEKNVFFMENLHHSRIEASKLRILRMHSQGFWSRFFPANLKLQEELKVGLIGDVHMVQASFGANIQHVPRITKKELGGGALLDIGCYTIQLALQVLGDLPQKVISSGILKDGVDEAGFLTLFFSGNRVAQLNYHAGVGLNQEAHIYGSKGTIKVPNFWNPETLITPTKKYEHPLPKSSRPMNYIRSEGFIYEADAVRESLLKGEKENPLMPHQDSINIMTILDEVRDQLGVVYNADEK